MSKIRPKIKNKFTYGFEIEGRFKRSLVEWLENQSALEIKIMNDGSVRVNRESDEIHYEELGIGIFSEPDYLLEILEKFDDENYFWNETCGFHLHIKPTAGNGSLRNEILSFYTLDETQKWAKESLCEHIKERLNGNTYCKLYQNLDYARHELKNHEKYRFMRNNPQYGTFEFRFLSCCEHKEENVEKFLNYFLGKIEEQLENGRSVQSEWETEEKENKDVKIEKERKDKKEQRRFFRYDLREGKKIEIDKSVAGVELKALRNKLSRLFNRQGQVDEVIGGSFEGITWNSEGSANTTDSYHL